MINWILSILVLKQIITEDEAKTLSRELPLRTHPTNFAEAHKIVQKILKDNN